MHIHHHQQVKKVKHSYTMEIIDLIHKHCSLLSKLSANACIDQHEHDKYKQTSNIMTINEVHQQNEIYNNLVKHNVK